LDILQLKKYLVELQKSSTRVLSVYYFKAQDGHEENYNKLFTHLSEIKRGGVLSLNSEFVSLPKPDFFKELFIFPLRADETLPEFFSTTLQTGGDVLIGAFISEVVGNKKKLKRKIKLKMKPVEKKKKLYTRKKIFIRKKLFTKKKIRKMI